MGKIKFYVVNVDVAKELDLTDKEVAIYFIILGFSQDGISAYDGGVDELSEAARCSKATVMRALQNMRELGIITAEQVAFGNTRYRANDSCLKMRPRCLNMRPTESQNETLLNKEEYNKESIIINNNTKERTESECMELFEKFRTVYRGAKRGLKTEFLNFKKRHADWYVIVETLLPLYQGQEQIKDAAKRVGIFVPQPKNLQTYINQRCWEEDYSGLKKQAEENEQRTTTCSGGTSPQANGLSAATQRTARVMSAVDDIFGG